MSAYNFFVSGPKTSICYSDIWDQSRK